MAGTLCSGPDAADALLGRRRIRLTRPCLSDHVEPRRSEVGRHGRPTGEFEGWKRSPGPRASAPFHTCTGSADHGSAGFPVSGPSGSRCADDCSCPGGALYRVSGSDPTRGNRSMAKSFVWRAVTASADAGSVLSATAAPQAVAAGPAAHGGEPYVTKPCPGDAQYYPDAGSRTPARRSSGNAATASPTSSTAPSARHSTTWKRPVSSRMVSRASVGPATDPWSRSGCPRRPGSTPARPDATVRSSFQCRRSGPLGGLHVPHRGTRHR